MGFRSDFIKIAINSKDDASVIVVFVKSKMLRHIIKVHPCYIRVVISWQWIIRIVDIKHDTNQNWMHTVNSVRISVGQEIHITVYFDSIVCQKSLSTKVLWSVRCWIAFFAYDLLSTRVWMQSVILIIIHFSNCFLMSAIDDKYRFCLGAEVPSRDLDGDEGSWLCWFGICNFYWSGTFSSKPFYGDMCYWNWWDQIIQFFR